MIRFGDIFELIKFKILIASIFTTCLGYFVSFPQVLWDFSVLFWGCFGVAFIFSSAAALNHLLEKNIDALMPRTLNRPLPSKRVSSGLVMFLIVSFFLLGLVILYLYSNLYVILCAMANLILYDFVYTPIKKITTLNTFVGAFPGAMPFLCGCLIASPEVNLKVIVLFFLFYFWQLPHFYSIAWINKESYKSGNLKMISIDDSEGFITRRYLLFSTIFFILFSYLPVIMGYFGTYYLYGVSLLNGLLLWFSMLFWKNRLLNIAKKILLVSVLYPILIFLFVMMDLIL